MHSCSNRGTPPHRPPAFLRTSIVHGGVVCHLEISSRCQPFKVGSEPGRNLCCLAGVLAEPLGYLHRHSIAKGNELAGPPLPY